MDGSIDLGPLHGNEADATRQVIEALIQRRPSIEGFLLTGSTADQERQIPSSDIDIKWIGPLRPSDTEGPTSVVDSHSFQQNGVEFDLSYFGPLLHCSWLPLSASIVLYRGHVLWQQGDLITRHFDELELLFSNSQWVESKIGFHSMALMAASDKQAIERSIQSGTFLRDYIVIIGRVLSCVDFRTQSVARKGLFAILEISSAIGLPQLVPLVGELLGTSRVSEQQCNEWLTALVGLQIHASNVLNEHKLERGSYYVDAAKWMLESEHPQAALWPIWRGLKDAEQLLSAKGFQTESKLQQLSIEMDLCTPRVDDRFKLMQEIFMHIQSELDMLTCRFQSQYQAARRTR